MLLNVCSLAQRKLVQAFFHNGTLALFATGSVPTTCHAVTITRAPVTVDPPQFTLIQCRRSGICSEVVTPYTVSQLFAVGTYRPLVIVTHADGLDEVAVEHIREYHSQGELNALGAAVLVPYVFPPSTARNSSADGIATGYSNAFDFGEAVREAIAALPPPAQPYQDQLSSITVVEVGAELGGIAGFQHLFVRVRRDPDARAHKPA
jgi:hypothetical protein